MKIMILTSLISWSLQCYKYTILNETNERYNVEVYLSCGGAPLKGHLEPEETLKLKSTGSRIGCCLDKVKIHPLASSKSMVFRLRNVCGNKEWVITKAPINPEGKFTSEQLERGYFINSRAGYKWE